MEPKPAGYGFSACCNCGQDAAYSHQSPFGRVCGNCGKRDFAPYGHPDHNRRSPGPNVYD